MTDHIAALEAALHTEAMNLPLEVLFGVLAEVEELREELAAERARADMHADLGRRTAEALGIPLEEGRSHMPEVAGRLRVKVESLRTLPTDAQIAAFAAAAGIEQQVRHSGGVYVLPTPVLRRFVEMVIAAQAAGGQSD
jgi:hypothetical protein